MLSVLLLTMPLVIVDEARNLEDGRAFFRIGLLLPDTMFKSPLPCHRDPESVGTFLVLPRITTKSPQLPVGRMQRFAGETDGHAHVSLTAEISSEKIFVSTAP